MFHAGRVFAPGKSLQYQILCEGLVLVAMTRVCSCNGGVWSFSLVPIVGLLGASGNCTNAIFQLTIWKVKNHQDPRIVIAVWTFGRDPTCPWCRAITFASSAKHGAFLRHLESHKTSQSSQSGCTTEMSCQTDMSWVSWWLQSSNSVSPCTLVGNWKFSNLFFWLVLMSVDIILQVPMVQGCIRG